MLVVVITITPHTHVRVLIDVSPPTARHFKAWAM
jgi:hypothetical protein